MKGVGSKYRDINAEAVLDMVIEGHPVHCDLIEVSELDVEFEMADVPSEDGWRREEPNGFVVIRLRGKIRKKPE